MNLNFQDTTLASKSFPGRHNYRPRKRPLQLRFGGFCEIIIIQEQEENVKSPHPKTIAGKTATVFAWDRRQRGESAATSPIA
jgi:hypothetical protein